ncbi:MAG: cysteine hydrolase family protein [Gemmatimonas sp.]
MSFIKTLACAAAGAVALAWTAAAQELPKLPPLDKTLKPSETAIILVDIQNNFAAKGGEHYDKYEKIFKETGFIDNTVALVKKARELGIQVIHVVEGYSNDYRELDWGNGAGFHRAQILRQAWKSGTWEVQLIDPLKPGPDDKDIVLANRITVSGFGNNGLDYMLKSRGIRNVAIGGISTEGCAYATMLSAYDLGYRVYSLPDVMASNRKELTELLLKDRYPQYSRVMNSKQFLQMFTNKQASAN